MKTLNYFFVFYLFFNGLICFGQINSGKIVYKVRPINFDLKSNDNIDKLIDEMMQMAEKQSFTLLFNNFKSSFLSDQFLNLDMDKRDRLMFKMASTRFTSNFNYFLDKKDKLVLVEKHDGILIKEKLKVLDWEIATESKKIGDFICYKAIYFKKFIGRDGQNKSIPVTAWFAPSLPYAYGPKEYNGLPGLILELTEKETTYYATNISIMTGKELKIDFPKRKSVNEAEYEKKVLSNLK